MTDGVTVIVAVIGVLPLLVAVNEGMFPVPLAPNPMPVLLFVHVNVPPEGILVKLVAATVALLQTVILEGTVTVGVGLTVIVYDAEVPEHKLTVGVTVMIAVIDVLPVFVAVNEGTFPVPFAPRPILVLLLTHVNVPPEGMLIKFVALTVAALQTVMLDGTVTVGVEFTVMV